MENAIAQKIKNRKIDKFLRRGKPFLLEELARKDEMVYCLVRWGMPNTGNYKKFYLDYQLVSQRWPEILIEYLTNRCEFVDIAQ